MIVDDRQLCPHESCNHCWRDDKNDRRCRLGLEEFLRCIGQHHGINSFGENEPVSEFRNKGEDKDEDS